MPLLSSLLVMARAHEESATKGKWMKAAWRGKREKAATHGHKLTSQCPAWLSLDKKAEEFRVNEERATVIRRIFDMTLEGAGKRKIAERLNIENVATFGRSAGWQSSYIQKILDNEAVIGISQPMRREYGEDGRRVRIADGEPLQGYYPVIVDKAVFHRAREMRTTRRISGGQTGKRFSNVFSGLARCGACGASMHYLNKGRGWMDPSRKSGGALHRLHCFCLEFDGACEVQRRVPTDWIIEPVDVSGYGSFSLAS